MEPTIPDGGDAPLQNEDEPSLLELNPSGSSPELQHLSEISPSDNEQEQPLGGRKKRTVPTIVFILTPIVILLPLIYILAAFLPPPKHEESPPTLAAADVKFVMPSLLSIAESCSNGVDEGGEVCLVDSRDNKLYQHLDQSTFHWTETNSEFFSEDHVGQPETSKYFLLEADKNELSPDDALTLTWSEKTVEHDLRRQYDSIISDDDVLALYCPASEPDPKKFRDAATIAQVRATQLLNRQNGGSTDGLDNIWTIHSFPTVREGSCEFRLYDHSVTAFDPESASHQKSFSFDALKLDEDKNPKSLYRWLSSSMTQQVGVVANVVHHLYKLMASTGPIILVGKQSPTSIHISLTGNPTEMNIHFTTGNAGKPVVEIALKSSFKRKDSGGRRYTMHLTESAIEWTKVEGVSTSYVAEDMCQAPATSSDKFVPPGQLHTVKVTNLQTSTDYVYRVGIAAGQGIQWSEYFVFRSSPPRGASQSGENLTFIALADQGCQSKERRRFSDSVALSEPEPDPGQKVANLITSLVNNQTIHSIHHFGDLSYANGDARVWDLWMQMIEPYASSVPVMVGIGNHEYDHTAGGGGKDPSGLSTDSGFDPEWGNFGKDSGGECGVPVVKRFSAPDNGNGIFWYSYDQLLVHTIMLSSEHNMTAGSAQYKWLEKDLQNVNRTITPWVVVEMHRPLYNSEIYYDQDIVGIAMRDEIEELLYSYRVDLSLSGHLHSYLRTCDGLYQGNCNNGGPTYIIVGTGGAPLDESEEVPNDWTEAFDSYRWGVGKATAVNSSSLHWEFIDVSGEVTDEVWLFRDRSEF